ncbi:MAG: glutathione S-transferase [Methylotenera sp.]|nr:glutathione S-transferase [Methylotenera sp.]
MAALPLLYSYRRCPYAMRARMALAYAGVAYQLHEVSLKEKQPGLLAVSPKGTVPVLLLPDGRVLEQSLDIMHWALQQHDAELWLGGDAKRTQSLIAENDGEFKRALDNYKYASHFPEQAPESYRAQGTVFLQTLEQQLSHQPFLSGSHLSLSDVAIFPFIRQFAAVDDAWFAAAPYPKLHAWLQQRLASSLFLQVMAKPLP